MKRYTSHALGIRAEKWASLYLKIKGYRILSRRFKCKAGEIDLIVSRDDILAFVEVKAHAEYSQSLEAVHERTQHRIMAASKWFVKSHPQLQDKTWRFDVVIVSFPFSRGRLFPKIHHICNAFGEGF